MVATKLMTAQQLWELGSEADRMELLEGEVRQVPAGGSDHGRIGGRLFAHLSVAVLARELGEVFISDTGFIVSRDPDTVLMPDISFVALERPGRSVTTHRFAPFAPDLAVEIESPTDREGDLLRRVALYLMGGTRLVWLVRPRHQTITVFKPGEAELTLSRSDTLVGGDIVPGFELALETFWARFDR